MNESVVSSLTAAASRIPSDPRFTKYLYGIASVICWKNLPGDISRKKKLCFGKVSSSTSVGQVAFVSTSTWNFFLFFLTDALERNCIARIFIFLIYILPTLHAFFFFFFYRSNGGMEIRFPDMLVKQSCQRMLVIPSGLVGCLYKLHRWVWQDDTKRAPCIIYSFRCSRTKTLYIL